MSQANLEAIDLEPEVRSQNSHAIDRSTSDSSQSSKESFASFPPPASPSKEKEDIRCESPYPVSFPPRAPTKTVDYLHAKDDFPDGGLRAWLVVLGVRSWVLVCGRR